MESSPSPLISSLFTDYFRLFLAVGPSNVATAGPKREETTNISDSLPPTTLWIHVNINHKAIAFE